MEKKTYICEECDKEIELSTDDEIPECCGKKMKQMPLDICTQPAHPEHARPMRDDPPCDNGRSGN